jgi:uncharacterized protein YcnI
MSRKAKSLAAGVAVAALAAGAAMSLSAGTAQAAVFYCKTVGVPKGCVARPTAAAVVATPAAAAVVATPGVGAPGVGVRAGTPMNRGGPVNRVGVR